MKFLWLIAISISAVSATICPGGKQCPGAETCCIMSGGQYGCCPYSSAVCCADRQHCCPSGYTCSYNICVRQANNTSNENVLKKNDKMKKCPSEQDECPDIFTCCSAKQVGRYGCCPLSNAVCCEDNVHCCPLGTTCDLVKKQCKLNGISMPLVRKIESTTLESSKSLRLKAASAKPANTVCPDPRYSCSGTDPCCRTPGGTWTCCMYPLGTCCSDGLHCCPYGMQCLGTSYCVKDNVIIPTEASPFSKLNSSNTDTVVCPDQHQCPDGNTCCKIPGDTYGCCPLPNAVCCLDDIHCCPHGYTCNVQSGSCSDGVKEIPWLTKTPTY